MGEQLVLLRPGSMPGTRRAALALLLAGAALVCTVMVLLPEADESVHETAQLASYDSAIASVDRGIAAHAHKPMGHSAAILQANRLAAIESTKLLAERRAEKVQQAS